MTPADAQDRAEDESVLAQTRQFWAILRFPETKNTLVLFAGLIVLVIVLNATAQVRLNTWQGDFYDAISNKNLSIFYRQLGVYAILIAILLSLGFAQTWIHETLKVS